MIRSDRFAQYDWAISRKNLSGLVKQPKVNQREIILNGLHITNFAHKTLTLPPKISIIA
jgi:hypothetical protein